MGLGHTLQIVGKATEVDGAGYDWKNPPQIERKWLTVINADDEITLKWRTRTVKDALDGVGLRCTEAFEPVAAPTFTSDEVRRHSVQDWHDPHTWTSSLVLRRWPREVAPGWLGQALASDIPVTVGIHIQPQDPQRIARFLKRQASWQADTGKTDAGNQLGRDDAERVRMALVAQTDRPCKVAIAFTVRAPTLELLKQRVGTLGHELGLTLADVREATFEHDRGLEATLPTGRCNLLGAWHTLDCTSIASTWPFQPATVNHRNGAPLGTTNKGGMLVKLDPFDESLESFGGIVLAKVGAGKSFFLKLLVRRLNAVEVLIVEQRTPAEYTGIKGAQSLNLADVDYSQRAAKLREFVANLWETAKRDPRPRLLVLDELWSLLRDPKLAELVEEIARIGRHHYLSLWIATQQVTELLEDRGGKAVFDNAAIRVLLKQHDRDLESLTKAAGWEKNPGPRRFLRGAARGQALLDVGGMLLPVDIQATPSEHVSISTDPREGRRNGSDSNDVGALPDRRLALAGIQAGADVDRADLRGSDRLPYAAARQ